MKYANLFFLLLVASADLVGQTKQLPKARYSIDQYLEFGFSATTYKVGLRPGWENLFQPPNPGMSVSTKSRQANLQYRFGIRPIVSHGRTQISIPISYNIVSLNWYGSGPKLFDDDLGGTYVNWWDQVRGKEIIARHFSPRVGVEFGNEDRAFAFSVQHYKVLDRDYIGKDCYGCRNTSSILSSKTLGSGVSPRIDWIFSRKLEVDSNSDEPFDAGLFFESIGVKWFKFGIYIRAGVLVR